MGDSFVILLVTEVSKESDRVVSSLSCHDGVMTHELHIYSEPKALVKLKQQHNNSKTWVFACLLTIFYAFIN